MQELSDFKAAFNRLNTVCHEALISKKLDDNLHKNRLAKELKEIDDQNDSGYFLDLYDKKVRYGENQNNLLVPYLLGIVSEVDVNHEPEYIFGDLPDIDTDYLPVVRDYLKNVWAPKEFGADCVCNIGSYTSFGIKSCLIDMAKVHGKSRDEIISLTTKIGLKDEDGKTLTFDKALELYPDLKRYCDDNPDVADATRHLLHRNRGMGMHAGGLIISSKPIADLVPLVKGKENTQVSAWVEGLHGQDLGPMGLVKFDLLVITNILQIAKACKLIKERHGISIMSEHGLPNWSDTSYLNDKKALAMANDGDLKCIFQFDSDGIRRLVKDGGVDCFENLVDYTSLYRPGCLTTKMHERYVERKRGREEYTLHPILQPILSKTYGTLLYQEICMSVLNKVGDIPLKDCEGLRKAISKKDDKKFAAYKEMFVQNGKKNLCASDEEIESLWHQLEAHSGYSFNLSHATAYTMISSRLLYLKAHFPLEFYTAILSCETLADKIKDYKLEAHRHGIDVQFLDINKSKVVFDIVDEQIYFGVSNVKGIGEGVAAKVVANQPYTSFEDFLRRYGTDASTVKPLLALGAFKGDPIRLWKYYEYYKKANKKNEDRQKRHEAALMKFEVELKDILGDAHCQYGAFNEEMAREWKNLDEAKALDKLWKKHKRSCAMTARKAEDEDNIVKSMENWTPENWDVDEKWKSVLLDPYACQREYLGFLWTHPIESSPDYVGSRTFDSFRLEVEERGLSYSIVEVMITDVQEKMSKNGNTYYMIIAEDANSEKGMIIFWMDDYERFKPELVKGNFVRMEVMAPDPGFRSYKFNAPMKHLRYRLPSKRDDLRLYVMRQGEIIQKTKKPESDGFDVEFS